MDGNLQKSIDAILQQWNEGFARLQATKEQGGAVTPEDVRAVLMDAGKGLYEAGLSDEVIQNQGYKKDQLMEVHMRVTSLKQPSELAGGIPLDPYQIASLESTPAEARSALIEQFKQNPDFEPTITPAASTVDAPQDALAVPVTPPVSEQSVEDKATQAAKTLFEKISPPEDLTEAHTAPPETSSSATSADRDLQNKLFTSTQNTPEDPDKPKAIVVAAGASLDDPTAQPELMQMSVRVIQPSNAQQPNEIRGPL